MFRYTKKSPRISQDLVILPQIARSLVHLAKYRESFRGSWSFTRQSEHTTARETRVGVDKILFEVTFQRHPSSAECWMCISKTTVRWDNQKLKAVPRVQCLGHGTLLILDAELPTSEQNDDEPQAVGLRFLLI